MSRPARQGRRLARPKFLVPLVLLLWLLVSAPLSFAQTDQWTSGPQPGPIDPPYSSTDPACPRQGEDPTAGVGGQRNRWGAAWNHLTVYHQCYVVTGTLVHGDVWGDGDDNFYMVLDPGQRDKLGVSSGEVKKLQRWWQARNTANFLIETIPDHQTEIKDPCQDTDQNAPSGWTGNYPCYPLYQKSQGIKVRVTGILAKDNNHGWKELHPVRRVEWYDSGYHSCSLGTDDSNCATPVINYVSPPKQR